MAEIDSSIWSEPSCVSSEGLGLQLVLTMGTRLQRALNVWIWRVF